MLACTFLTGCESTESDGANYSFDYAIVGNPESLDPQYSSDKSSMTIIGNMFMGLLSVDDKGVISNAAAENYTVSSDGLKYTFTISDKCYWFYDENENESVDDNEKFPVTADDFVFAFQRIFNPETCSPHRETYACIKNAESIINGGADYKSIGVTANGDKEVVFELDYPNANFLNLLTLTPAMPCNEEFFLSTKGRYGLDDKSVISNGAFFVRQWFYDPYGHDNFVYMQRNLANDELDKIYPMALNFYIKDSWTESAESFEQGESDVLISYLYDESKYEECNVRKYNNYTLGLIINPESPRYSNGSIKRALAYGIDKESFNGQLPEDLQLAYGVIPPDISFLNRSYRELNSEKLASVDKLGETISYNPELALKYYNDGMSQLGIQSLDNIKILVPENLMDTEYLHLVTQNWQTLLGIYIGIEEVPEDEYSQRIADKEYTLAIYAVSGEYNSPLSVLEKFVSGDNEIGFSNSEFDSSVSQLKKLSNMSEGVELYLKAEQQIISDFVFIPVFYKTQYEIMSSGNDDILFDPFTDQLNFRHAKYFG